jgi:dTDP-4-dehydrorhamnose reductase
MRVVITGARGQLGAALVQAFEAGHDVTPFGHEDLDVTDDAAVANAMEPLGPEAILNAAAYNEVDAAEAHPVDALNLNAFAVRALARAAERAGALLVHYSTDFVFDGKASAPYTEDDRPGPRSVYAASKLIGEWFAADAPKHYVVRVESLFGRVSGARPAKGSIAGMVKTLEAGGALKVFEDRTVSPTYIVDAADATRQLLERQPPAGVYHCVNSGSCTWLELAEELARRLGVPPRLVPVRMGDVPLRAERPRYCALSNEKLRAAGIAMPTWEDALARYVTHRTVERVPSIADSRPATDERQK